MTAAHERAPPPQRAAFPVFRAVPTRWMDNDHYGHVNNVAYYSWFDTAVNGWLIDASGVDIRELPAIGLVVETSCRYFEPLSFPDIVEVGLAVEKLGARSVTYSLGVFRRGAGAAAAAGRFVHVYVDAATRRPTEVPAALRAALAALAA